MTPEAQQKIRGMVELALSYVVEPKPLEVPTAPGAIEELVEKMTKGLTITDSKDQAQVQLTDEEAWDGESFGVRLAGLGKLLSNDVTKTSLACKPPAESKTVIGMIDALGETCFRLAGFVDSVPVHLAGQTYKAEIQVLANNIFLATAALLNEFLEVPVDKVLHIQQQKSAIQASVSGLAELPTSSTPSSSAAESGSDGYLMKTGIVWEACQIFEQASRSNRQAVAKKWGDMMSTMEDAIAEVQDMIDSNDEDNDGDSDDEDSGNESDDSWNTDEKLTEEEKQLSIRANALLKLTKMLFKKLQQRCLDTQSTTTSTSSSGSSMTPQPSDLAKMWDQLYDRARGIVELADEIATSLYSPQEPESIVSMLQELSRKNHDCILVGRLFVRGQVEHERWMDMCETQTQKILGTVLVK
ncbi:hypothetical protein BGZ59_006233 [Podila verticillata]|nr:hypothetical protein BGZ59_006233 [Podila verticillata]KFH64541.1 hypothetical protein MVEG_09274 [Podila verticillata NRRL 6337]